MLTIDWDSLRTSSMQDSALAAELIELFLSDTPSQLQGLSSRIEASDVTGIQRMAHKLRGSCLTIGAASMAGLCEQLEAAAEKLCLEDLRRLDLLLSQEFVTFGVEFRGKVGAGNLFADAGVSDD